MANCNGWSIVHFTPPDADLNGEERFFWEEVFGSFFLTFMGEMPDGFNMGTFLCPKIFQKKNIFQQNWSCVLRISRKNLSSNKINPGIFFLKSFCGHVAIKNHQCRQVTILWATWLPQVAFHPSFFGWLWGENKWIPHISITEWASILPFPRNKCLMSSVCTLNNCFKEWEKFPSIVEGFLTSPISRIRSVRDCHWTVIFEYGPLGWTTQPHLQGCFVCLLLLFFLSMEVWNSFGQTVFRDLRFGFTKLPLKNTLGNREKFQ